MAYTIDFLELTFGAALEAFYRMHGGRKERAAFALEWSALYR